MSFAESNNEEQRPKKEKKKKRKKEGHRRRSSHASSMEDAETTSLNGSDEMITVEKPTEKRDRNAEKSVAEFEEQERQEVEAKKKQREPPIIYKDLIDVWDFCLTL